MNHRPLWDVSFIGGRPPSQSCKTWLGVSLQIFLSSYKTSVNKSFKLQLFYLSVLSLTWLKAYKSLVPQNWGQVGFWILHVECRAPFFHSLFLSRAQNFSGTEMGKHFSRGMKMPNLSHAMQDAVIRVPCPNEVVASILMVRAVQHGIPPLTTLPIYRIDSRRRMANYCGLSIIPSIRSCGLWLQTTVVRHLPPSISAVNVYLLSLICGAAWGFLDLRDHIEN